MPGLPSTVVLDALSRRNTTPTASNTTGQVLHVICEFPLSGQYGLGYRLLYYILITACLLGNKSELLKQVCLAAALIFPTMAAIHAVLLAALHNDGFVDMDIFGAFHLCAIGILVAPVTVKQSKTYWVDRGKKLILPWAILIVTGLLSLTVEFCRTKTHLCPYDDSGQPTSIDPRLFNYTSPPTCNLTCSTNLGPFSRIRQGSASSVFVVPAPDRITFGMGALFSAGCCIPPVLYLVYMWIKILKENWTAAFAVGDDEQDGDQGTTATPSKMEERLRGFLKWQESICIGALVFCIAVLGELNFFSAQIYWQSEPFSAVGRRFPSFALVGWLTALVLLPGQWATIIGPAFAVSGALFIKERRRVPPIILKIGRRIRQLYRDRYQTPSQGAAAGSTSDERRSPSHASGRTSTEAAVPPPSQAVSVIGERASGESQPPMRTPSRTATSRLLTPSQNLFPNDMESRREGNRYTETPGEPLLSKHYPQIKALYEQVSGAKGSTTPRRGQHSRSGSFTSVNSGSGIPLGELGTASREHERTSSEQLRPALQRSPMLEVPSAPIRRRASVSS